MLRGVNIDPLQLTSKNDLFVCPFDPMDDADVDGAARILAEAVSRARGAAHSAAIRTELTFTVPRIEVAGIPCILSIKADDDRKAESWYRFSVRTAEANRIVCAGAIVCSDADV